MQVLIIVGGKKDPQLQTFSVKDPWGHDIYNYKSPLIRQTEDYISSHLTERLTLATVAANVYVSPWYLDKQIAQETGNGFCWMVTSARVEVAKNLLKQQDLKIGEIRRDQPLRRTRFFQFADQAGSFFPESFLKGKGSLRMPAGRTVAPPENFSSAENLIRIRTLPFRFRDAFSCPRCDFIENRHFIHSVAASGALFAAALRDPPVKESGCVSAVDPFRCAGDAVLKRVRMTGSIQAGGSIHQNRVPPGAADRSV